MKNAGQCIEGQGGIYEAPLLSVIEVEIERGFSESDEWKFLLGPEDAIEDGWIY